MTRHRAGLLLLGLSLVSARPAWAQSAPPAAPADEGLAAAARELNRHGIKLLDAGDRERALEYFLRSRGVQPNAKNTANAAIVLEQMGRFDEALELYEELLIKHAAGLDDDDRKAIAPAMAGLRQKVGSVAVSSDAGGSVVIDGRPRGTLPLATPIRILEGRHVVRVVKTGHTTFERTIDVRIGETASVDAKLEPLRGVGQLVIEDAHAPGADVFVDRVKVGAAPWEGALKPGRHVVWTVKGDAGSAPTWVTVLEGQTALARVESKPLGPIVRVRVEPRAAAIELGGTLVGSGSWEGRLPAGTYAITVTEPGYHARTAELRQGLAGTPTDLAIELPIDRAHPRWPRAASGELWVDALGGWAVGSSLASDVESGCPESCTSDSGVNGFVAGVRGGYRFPFGMAVELGGGYMSLATSIKRTETDASGAGASVPVRYELDDELRVRGPFATVGVSHRLRFASRFSVHGRAAVGLLFARTTDPVVGDARTTGEAVPVGLEGRNQELSSAAVFVAPEIGTGARLGPVDVGLSLAAAIFATDGPSFSRGRMGPTSTTADAAAGSIGSAKESSAIQEERAYGRFVVWVPHVTIGRTF